MSRASLVNEDQLAGVDVAALLAGGMRGPGAAGGMVSGCAVPAAIQAGLAGVRPRSLSFLAELVRRGGARYAARLPEPLPTPEQSALVRPWLAVAAEADGADESFARWLEAVAAIIDARDTGR
ncbi:hypothetical protein ACFQFC_27945 [Amorphoplanes digitatis]|uniref:Sulfite reductase beta subunit-like hemoprotein n=1 Tax=Actinoplanes digitatis TaxID=1868 RepID=A0A7W7HSR0_9ACTN|nr:hypothetical protein [Actinoplanes digitatis]MBB4759978.1 sulfite reductase beta subunit-like hemoprotein [Actinoplanes digitatis]BFE67988.1 hypothetical protein GCM10020092_012890 [Actinoplanes digitatis]GID96526.1 hypothetical protein Adi01nite_59380 [Actinoplanes digitatis]